LNFVLGSLNFVLGSLFFVLVLIRWFFLNSLNAKHDKQSTKLKVPSSQHKNETQRPKSNTKNQMLHSNDIRSAAEVAQGEKTSASKKKAPNK